MPGRNLHLLGLCIFISLIDIWGAHWASSVLCYIIPRLYATFIRQKRLEGNSPQERRHSHCWLSHS